MLVVASLVVIQRRQQVSHVHRFIPNLDALRLGGVPMVTAVGRASGDAFYVQTARQLARELPCPCVEMIGHHVSYAIDPIIFAKN